VHLVEIRLLEGPNVYRLEPVVKVEVSVGRHRPWTGERGAGVGHVARLGARVRTRDWPDDVAAVAAWLRRLRSRAGGSGGVEVHRGSDPGHWILTYPLQGLERDREIAEAAVDLAGRNVSPARRVHLTGTQERRLGTWQARIDRASASPPSWIRDADRSIPAISISGTNGKSTTSRLISRILLDAGRRVGTTTSDGILVDERMVEPGDWTGPGGAAAILGRGDVDVAVLETARGGIVLRGVGYESNDASVLTNVSADHLDLQGIHTLAELAEVKATICRITQPTGWVILNADDPNIAAVARRVRARIAYFAIAGDRSARLRRHLAAGGRGYLVRRGVLGEAEGGAWRPIVEAREIPIALGGLATYNVENALAAAAGARAMGATIEEVRHGLIGFRPSADASPGRLNLFRHGGRIVLVDFAHNEAGVAAVLGVAAGIAGGAAGRAVPISVIIGTAGDRPDDTLRAIGRIAGREADRVAIKETLRYLRGRSREEVVERLREGLAQAGLAPTAAPLYESEVQALRAELDAAATADGRPIRGEAGRVVVLLCHEDRPGVFALLADRGYRPITTAADLLDLVPRLEDRPRR
jgi:cyanophycin synthetase